MQAVDEVVAKQWPMHSGHATAPVATMRVRLATLLALCVLAIAFQGARPVWDPDEGRYLSVAQEMLESGEWLVPSINDHHEHLTKPPLAYWLVAASLQQFGHNTWAARLPNALAFVLTGCLLLTLGTRLVPARPWLPALLWATSLLPLLAATVVTTDTLLVLFETLAVTCWLQGRDSGLAQPRWRLALWLACGLGFMTKGPPALLPLLPIAAFELATRGRAGLRALVDARALCAFVLVGGSWFAWLVLQRPELVPYFVGYEFVDRIFTAVHDRNPQWYGAVRTYLPVLVLAALPWAVLDRRWIGPARRLWRPAFWRALLRDDPDRAFLLLWFLLPLLVFMLARSRLYLYVLPLAVPMALLLARSISQRAGATLPRRWRIGLGLWFAVALGMKAATASLPSHKDAAALAAQLQALAPDSERVLFFDHSARYGLRFYLGVPVEQVGTPHTSSLQARGEREHALCDDLALFPRALIVTDGRLLADSGGRIATAPTCPGFALHPVGVDSGLWRGERVAVTP